MTMPSAGLSGRIRFQPRMAQLITGVGVCPRPAWIRSSTPSAARTSRAVTKAGSERAWVSVPR